MKRRLVCILCLLVLLTALVLPTFAESEYHLFDEANLLSSSEADQLENYLKNASQEGHMGIYIVTDTLYKSDDEIKAYAEYLVDYLSGHTETTYGSGILLFVDMGSRGYTIAWTGDGNDYMNNRRESKIRDEINSYLHDGNYSGAFRVFADRTKEDLANKIDEKAEKLADYKDALPRIIFWSIVIGLIIAGIAVKKMKGQLQSVRPCGNASDYTRDNSLNITNAQEFYLYKTMSRTAKPQSSSSSGRSGGSHSSHSSHSGGVSHF